MFLFAVAIPEVVEVTPDVDEVLEGVNWMVWAIFAELGVMTYLAPNRWRYLREHWIDVLTVLVPFLRPLPIAADRRVSVRLWTEARTLIPAHLQHGGDDYLRLGSPPLR